MWDSFLIFTSKHPFWAVFSPIACSYLIGFRLDKKMAQRFFYYTGGLSALVIATFLHLRWDSFSIHMIPNEVESLSERKVLFLGDSITCEGARPRGFITKLESVLSIDAQVVCQKGATAEEIIQLFNSESINPIPDMVVVQAGINDLLGGSTAAQTIDAQEKLLSVISKRFSDSKVFFLPIHPILYQGNSLEIPMDIKSFWTRESNFAEKFLTADGVHLNAKGHTLLAANIIKLLT
jgi:lysophospholipase L1-like esterase